MIYTVTLNPAVDYVVQVENFEQDTINRSKSDYKEAGGKGINVSRVLDRFGGTSTALGFVGGFTGKFITDYLTEVNIPHNFVSLEEDTRINVKLKSGSEETEVNGKSPLISEQAYNQFIEKLQGLSQGDMVVLAGSLPSSLPQNTYQTLTTMLNKQGISVILDTSGAALKEAIKAGPAFIKPNNHELADLFGEEVNTDEDIIMLAKRLHQENKIDHVLVSMAKEGAIYVGASGVFKLSAPVGKAINSVGAGDSAVAGFIYKWQETKNAEESAKYAVASGSATAFSKTLCTKEEAENLLKEVEITKL
ncbi:1-phosphofructokinase [Gracilibacillus oryzae]|uniref:Tagatose-6-phosphate kinase n=1 Tax=Gracilibacillus oryzae TaxID=1672701 RepID=A0A7C8KQM7_9BACI|nr:1-phosphofructokinase [Gracilibacillus oryzae]KAB8137502.1 1-phosphofructokinase [Gracilibacillus oryzae]